MKQKGHKYLNKYKNGVANATQYYVKRIVTGNKFACNNDAEGT